MRHALIAMLICSIMLAPTVTSADDPEDTGSLTLMETSCYDWAASGGHDIMKGILCLIYTMWTDDFNYDRPWG